VKKRSREELSPDITPLIDVVFLLLIFFMTSTVFKKDELALALSLPKGQAGEGIDQRKKSIVIELDSSELAVNGSKISIDELAAKLSSVSKEKEIELRVSKNVVYERVIEILDTLKSQKLSNLNLVTKEIK